MKLKICGLKEPDNYMEVIALNPDFTGFIFYDKSPRAIVSSTDPFALKAKNNIQRVGVFVDAPISFIQQTVTKFDLDYIQLHGNESVTYISELKKHNYRIIKAFGIHSAFEWSILEDYQDIVDYLLFDTSTKNYGGSGIKFNWTLLENYTGNTPFFLSGGISHEDIPSIKKVQHPQLYGIDMNSKLEDYPGHKNIDLIQKSIKALKNEQ